MVKEAEKYAELDKKKKEEAEARNNADSLIYTAEKTKKELAGKITEDQVKKIDDAVAELKETLKGKDVEKIKEKNEALAKTLQEIGAAVYRQAAASAASTASTDKKKNEKVVDAEYEDVKKEKK